MASRPSFLEVLAERVILGDGGMGSEIYGRGIFINRCYDELNVSSPQLVQAIHGDFLKAGSELIEANTYGANRPKLAGHGLEERLEDILRGGVRLARETVPDTVFVAGSVGPLGPAAKAAGLSDSEQAAAYEEVARILAEEGADLVFLDTFTSVHDLRQAIAACKRAADLPVVASFSFHRGFVMNSHEFLVQPQDVAAMAVAAGADAVGANCGDGPHTTLEVVETLHKASGNVPIAAMPNVGGPALIEGRQVYLSSPEYMAEYSRRFVQKGARIIGGCCGVTPQQIKEVRSFLASIQPRKARIEVGDENAAAEPVVQPKPIAERSAWGAGLGTKFQVSVELDPPNGLDPMPRVEKARFLYDNGVDAVNMADGPRAIARTNPASLAQHVRREVGMETIVHYCCRDRNVMAMQMDLIGAHSLGQRNLMLITGDPPKMGNFPDATAVFDVDAIGLVTFARMLNEGVDLSGKPLGNGEHTDFVIGVGCNPGAVDIDLEVDRFRRKIEAGAEFVFSQPVYDIKRLERFLELSADHPRIPFFVGILPLASLKNAEFLTREVPGMEVPDEILERLRSARTKEDQREVGIRVATESLAAAADHAERIKGAYIFPPFGRYEPILRVLKDSGVRD
ncbi:MAG: bifunctional homocysteine S-methyltransferase/methylenetetrahydrofolate reductase [Planctomycetota bacterium]|nr:MAG: bifunctional homocysteine S-methyltransferase/methylenetetrahydrofolate reductase [Planctomycetota bacterium]